MRREPPLPDDLKELEVIERYIIQRRNSMWEDRATRFHYVADESRSGDDREIRYRFQESDRITLLGAHPELGEVSYRSDAAPGTVVVRTSYGPWITI